jgi:hypothetical protein
MATTTTNFGWDIPQSTDLVKDGATAIAALGQDIDTAFVDFKGGTTGQVLKKTSGTDLDVEWGTASSGLTLINTTSFSGVSSVSLPASTFTATYDNYLIKFNKVTSSASSYVTVRLRAAGTDETSANYKGQQLSASSTTISGVRYTSNTFWEEMLYFDTHPNEMELFLANPFNTTITSAMGRTNIDSDGNIAYIQLAGGLNTTTSYDSLTVAKTSGTFTGSVSVYGLAK